MITKYTTRSLLAVGAVAAMQGDSLVHTEALKISLKRKMNAGEEEFKENDLVSDGNSHPPSPTRISQKATEKGNFASPTDAQRIKGPTGYARDRQPAPLRAPARSSLKRSADWIPDGDDGNDLWPSLLSNGLPAELTGHNTAGQASFVSQPHGDVVSTMEAYLNRRKTLRRQELLAALETSESSSAQPPSDARQVPSVLSVFPDVGSQSQQDASSDSSELPVRPRALDLVRPVARMAGSTSTSSTQHATSG